MIGEAEGDADVINTIIDESAFGSTFSTKTTFVHSFIVDRALDRAAADKKVSRTFVILACLLGKYDIRRYIDEFNEEDLMYVHERNLEALGRRDTDRSIDEMADRAVRVGECLETLARKVKSKK